MASGNIELNEIARQLAHLLRDVSQLPASDEAAIATWARAFSTYYSAFENQLRDGNLHYRTFVQLEEIKSVLHALDELARSLVSSDSREYPRDQLVAAFLTVAVAARTVVEPVLREYAQQNPRKTQTAEPPEDMRRDDDDAWADDDNYRGGADDVRFSRASANSAATSACYMVPVHFGTTRAMSPEKRTTPGERFLPGRGTSALSLGVASVSLPVGHRMGEIEAPAGVWRFSLAANPAKHVMLREVTVIPADEWIKSTRAEMDRANSKSAFLFIHGFNVSYEEAMLRAAQIAFDVDYKGVISAFSWGSEGRVLGYMADEVSVRLAIPALCEFLRILREDVGVEHVDVIGHSMGCRAIIAALQEMPGASDSQPFPWRQVIFAAPDVDAQEYRAGISKVGEKARRYTLYGSQNDWALVVSRALRSDFPRAGEAGTRILVMPKVETIDATAVGGNMFGLGHSYIGSQRSILTDLTYVLMGHPMPRAGLMAKEHEDGRYWIFRA